MQNIGRPAPSEHASYFGRYIALVPEDDIVKALGDQCRATRGLLDSIDEKRAGFRYAPDKWSIKEVVGHITDAERVFAYRLMVIARGEKQPLPGFDENDYVRQAGFDAVPLHDLVENLAAVRAATLSLLHTLPDEAWSRAGIANKNEITARALAYTTLGHERHHLRVLKDKYGV